MKKCGAIVLAAGKGSRMNSTTVNKVALSISDKPIIAHTIENLKSAGLEDIVVVVGFASQSVISALADSVIYSHQSEQRGTAHAVQVGLKKLPLDCQLAISVYGDDSAFYPPQLIKDLIAHHQKNHSAVTVVTINKQNPTGLGRIIRDSQGNFRAIVEEKVADSNQKKITEINTGLFCFDRQFLDENIGKIQKNAISGEYYLTDIVEVALALGLKVEALLWSDDAVWCGINTPEELERARQKMSNST